MKYRCANKNLELVLPNTTVLAPTSPSLELTVHFLLTKTQAHTFYWQKMTASYSSTRDVSVVSTNRFAVKFTGTFSPFFLSLKSLAPSPGFI